MEAGGDDEADSNLLAIFCEDHDPRQEEEKRHLNPSLQPHSDHRHHLTSLSAWIVTRQLPYRGLSFQLWPSAFSLVSLLDRNPAALLLPSSSPIRILELGSGTGLVGIAAAAILGADVTLTDLPQALLNLRFNAIENADVVTARGGSVAVRLLRWSVAEDFDEIGSMNPSLDAVIASDVVYYEDLIEPLLETVRIIVKGQVGFLMAHLKRWRRVDAAFFRRARKFFDVLKIHTDPPATGSRTGVVIYRFTAKRRSTEDSLS